MQRISVKLFSNLLICLCGGRGNDESTEKFYGKIDFDFD